MTWPFPFSLVQPSAPESRRPGAALVAGLAGGLVGGAVKAGWEGWFPPLPEGRTPPPQVLAEQLDIDPDEFGYTYSGKRVTWLVPAVHYGFSAATIGLYAVLAEYLPRTKLAWGIPYGVGVWFVAHEIMLPRLKLTPPAAELPRDEQLSELFGHVAWVLASEFVRRDVRQRITGTPDADVRATAVRRLLATVRAGATQTVRAARR